LYLLSHSKITMKHIIAYFRTLIALCMLAILAACGGGGGSEETPAPVTPPTVPVVAEPAVTTISFNDSEISISWAHPLEAASTDPVDISYTFYFATEQIENDVNADGETEEEDLSLDDFLARFDGLAGATQIDNAESPLTFSSLTDEGIDNDTIYYFVITATTDDGTSDPLNELRFTPRDYSTSTIVQSPINDTGYTECGDFAYVVDVDMDGAFDSGVDIQNSLNHDNHLMTMEILFQK